VLARIGVKPTPLGRFLRGPLARRALERLAARGLVALGGFTPSDAGHVLGKQGQWSREAAFYGALLLQRAWKMLGGGDLETQARAVAQEVFDAVVAKTGRVLLTSLADASLEGAAPLIEAAVSGSGRLGGLRVAVAPRWPVVAVGGPAPVFYPDLGARLGCEVVLPPHGEVCNAVGAAVAVMRARAMADVSSLGLGGYRVHHDGEPIAVGGATEALALAQELAVSAARAAALASGIAEPVPEVRVERIDLPGSTGDLGLISASVVAECVAPAAANGYGSSS
jgi:N-methylhydantoinase A/oxoprolinase/acetone carboxylase beta subunit